MSDDGPKSGPRCIGRREIAHVLVRVEGITDDEDFDVNALCAVSAAIDGLTVPGSTVHRVTAGPSDGERALIDVRAAR